jgi:hypothetical protein
VPLKLLTPEKQQDRLLSLSAMQRERLNMILGHIKNGTGSPKNCVYRMYEGHGLWALESLLFKKDLAASRQHLYSAAKFACIYSLHYNGVVNSSHYFTALLCRHEPLIHWFSQNVAISYSNENEVGAKPYWNHADSPAFFKVNTNLALLRQWDLLYKRAERFLFIVPPSGRKNLQVDMRFYVALIEGNVKGMQKALDELLTKRILAYRKEYVNELGNT